MQNESEITTAIKTITVKINEHVTHEEALKYSQSVLNLAHAYATLKNADNIEKPR